MDSFSFWFWSLRPEMFNNIKRSNTILLSQICNPVNTFLRTLCLAKIYLHIFLCFENEKLSPSASAAVVSRISREQTSCWSFKIPTTNQKRCQFSTRTVIGRRFTHLREYSSRFRGPALSLYRHMDPYPSLGHASVTHLNMMGQCTQVGRDQRRVLCYLMSIFLTHKCLSQSGSYIIYMRALTVRFFQQGLLQFMCVHLFIFIVHYSIDVKIEDHAHVNVLFCR